MGKLILVLVGATAGVALAVFIAARRESRGPEPVQPLASTTPPPPTSTPSTAAATAATSATAAVGGPASSEASAGE